MGFEIWVLHHMKCKYKKCKKEATKNPYEKGMFCSSRCALNAVRTKKHQIKAAKASAKVNIERYRGTGTKTYVKELGRHQHRVVAEKMLGRKLKRGEVVHHIDHNKKNNDPSNLQVMTQGEHCRVHFKKGYVPKIITI